MAFELRDVRYLTMADIRNMPQYIIEEANLDDGYECDEDLKDTSYTISTLIHNNIHYTMVHGFPGDNADGIIYNDENIVAYIGESCDDVNEFTHWYLSFGDQVCELLANNLRA